MIRTIVFDIGNVLTVFRWEELIHSLGFSAEAEAKVKRATVGGPYWIQLDVGVWWEEQILNAFISEEPEAEWEIRQMFRSFSGILDAVDYALPWIRELKNRGFQVLVLSNISDKVVRDNPTAMSFMEEVDGGILSYREQVVKPGEEIYRRLLEKYDLKAEECVFLDDTQKNLDTAASLGFKTVLFRNYEQASEELERLLTAAEE